MAGKPILIILVVILAVGFCLIDVGCEQLRLHKQEQKEKRERERELALHGHTDDTDTFRH